MVDSSDRIQNPWMASEQQTPIQIIQNHNNPKSSTIDKLGIAERAFSAAGAAFLSAVIVNPLDVAKVLFLPLPTFFNFISFCI